MDQQKHCNQPRKGRGAISNRDGRFEAYQRDGIDDGWGALGDPAWIGDVSDVTPTSRKLRTEVTSEVCRSIIARNASPDVPFDRSINPYRGCEHGCIYCFARPSHAYVGLSPGLDFETKLFAKTNAVEALITQLRRKTYECAPIQLGANTDPYQPIEGRFGITRDILQVLSDCNHPVTITTKSDRVLQDLDLLSSMAERRLVSVALSVTSLDKDLARRLEPRAPRPEKRLEAIRQLTQAGVPVTVLTSPMIPALNDWELERILEAATDAGAKGAGYALLRLPLEISELFQEWLETHVPDRANRVLNQIRGTRDGALYDSQWGNRMKGTGVQAELLKVRFAKATKRLGLARGNSAYPLRTDLFQRPQKVSAVKELANGSQLTLF